MSTKLNAGEFDVYGALAPDEPYFPLAARDSSAPHHVVDWAMNRLKAIEAGTKPLTDVPMIREALTCAVDMVVWRIANRGTVGAGVAANTMPTWHDRQRGFKEQRALDKEVQAISPLAYVLQTRINDSEWTDVAGPGPLALIAKTYNETLQQPESNQEFTRSDSYRIIPSAP
jgi:hypothetical protein